MIQLRWHPTPDGPVVLADSRRAELQSREGIIKWTNKPPHGYVGADMEWTDWQSVPVEES